VTTFTHTNTNNKLPFNFKQRKSSSHNNVQQNGENSYRQRLAKKEDQSENFSPEKLRSLQIQTLKNGSWNEVKA
jgi:hypothetical protein